MMGTKTKRKAKHQGLPDAVFTEDAIKKLKRERGVEIEEPEAPTKKRRRDKGGKAAAPKSNGKTKATTIFDDDFISSEAESVVDSEVEDGATGEFVFSDDDEEEAREEKLNAANIVGLSKKLDNERAQQEAEADAEMRDTLHTNIEGDEADVLEDDEDSLDPAAKKKKEVAPDLQMLRDRIMENIRVLEDFAKSAQAGRSRSEYVSQLLKDIRLYYGYSDYLAEKLFHLFSPREAFAFFEANETPRPLVIRVNTLKTNRRELVQQLVNRGVTLEPVKFSKVGLQIFDSSVPLGATPEYLAGHYILQAASSFLPPMALAPQEKDTILDVSAAPGQIHRLGVKNTIVCNLDGRAFPKTAGGFDRVLLDAPCSGTGVISKDPSVKVNKNELDFQQLPHLQKQLILSAIDATKTNGHIVYSTCSVTIEENEQVVQYALSRRPNVVLVDTGLPIGDEGFVSFMGKKFHPSLKKTRRFYPHKLNVDGFFVAKFKKTGPTPPNAVMAPGSNNDGMNNVESVPEEMSRDAIVEGGEGERQEEGFGGFDDEEDAEYMERAKRNAMRRRGLDPRILKRNGAKERPEG